LHLKEAEVGVIVLHHSVVWTFSTCYIRSMARFNFLLHCCFTVFLHCTLLFIHSV